MLAISISGRTREFGIRLSVGSEPRHLLMRVVAEGGHGHRRTCPWLCLRVLVGTTGRQSSRGLEMPDALPVAGSALALLLAAVIASAIPALRRPAST